MYTNAFLLHTYMQTCDASPLPSKNKINVAIAKHQTMGKWGRASMHPCPCNCMKQSVSQCPCHFTAATGRFSVSSTSVALWNSGNVQSVNSYGSHWRFSFSFLCFQPHCQFHIFSQAFFVNAFLKSKRSVRLQFPHVTAVEKQTHSLENEDFTWSYQLRWF